MGGSVAPLPFALVLLLVTGGLAGCLQVPRADGPTLIDATGTAVPVGDLSRLVPTSHDLVEMLFELGAGDRVVAVPDWIDHPPAIAGLPRLGRPHVIQVEQVIAQDPSLVLVKDHPLQPTDLAAGLRQAGIPVFVFRNDETFDNIHYTYLTLGTLLEPVDPDAPQRARTLWERLDAERAALDARLANTTDRPAALYQLPVGFVAGTGTSADLLFTTARLQNIARAVGLSGYQQISEEVIVSHDPARIVASWTAAASPDVFFANPRLEGTTAARLGPETLLIVDPATTALVGPRFVDGIRMVAEWAHPAAFALIQTDLSDHLDGRTLHVTANATTADGSPVSYRFDAGDGSSPRDRSDGDFAHTYDDAGTYTFTLFVIDTAGRIDAHHRTVTIP